VSFTTKPCTTADDTQLQNCTLAPPNFWYKAACEPGDALHNGKDGSVGGNCTAPTNGFFVTDACRVGSPLLAGKDSRVSLCSVPKDDETELTDLPCEAGDIYTTGFDAEIVLTGKMPAAEFKAAATKAAAGSAAVAGASMAAGGGAMVQSIGVMQMQATLGYGKDDPASRQAAGMMTMVLFGIPSISPLGGIPLPKNNQTGNRTAAANARRLLGRRSLLSAPTEEEQRSMELMFGMGSFLSEHAYLVVLGLMWLLWLCLWAFTLQSYTRKPDPPPWYLEKCPRKTLGYRVACDMDTAWIILDQPAPDVRGRSQGHTLPEQEKPAMWKAVPCFHHVPRYEGI